MNLNVKKLQRGTSFLELIVAVALVGVVLTALVGLITRGIANETFARNKSLANSHAQEALEWIRSQRDANWSTFYSQAGTATWCLVSLNWSTNGSHSGACNPSDVLPQTAFRREATFTRVNAQTVEVSVRVIWADGNGTHDSSSKTILTNWKGNS